ncbi:anthocyanidin 3-O-glucosyltransferase 2-like [Neltuma alba]|uniref:anthocyanidin 3-O-glucosyltransferase 2-like n=1 Tax=Neltuma alba TaxID=207710 RepID=UPI0010A2CBD1|nr:anthocyanidin 3-O-glucosyltransferase 2-like [Prosopis alba]
MKKSQLVFVPLPSRGHLASTVEFAKLLVNRHGNLSVTILIIKAPYDPAGEAYALSLTSSLSFPKQLQFILLPDPNHDPNSNQSLNPASFIDSVVENQKLNVRQAVSALISGPDSPRLAGFVVDMYCSTMIDVADEFGVPTVGFFTAGAAFLGYMLHIHTLRERENVDTTALNFKDSGAQFAIPSFQNLVPANVFPGAALDKEWATFFYLHACRLKKAKGIIVNTFEELESHAVGSFRNADFTVYPVGPILSVGETESETIQRGSDVMEWLDGQPPLSVLFLCFGSMGCFDDDDQVIEIARSLERSGVHFVWSLRLQKPTSKPLEAPSDCSNPKDVLPEGFLERTAKSGKVIGWAPQAQILAHKAVGGFVSHCGWNSILESIYYGVPIATWPLYSEQQLNAFELARELKLGVEISLDYRMEFGDVSKSGVISAERIEKGIKQVMERESEVRKKVKEMSEMSKRALMEGGSSYSYLGRFIHDILN